MKKNVQLWVAVFLCFCGVVLLFCGFWVAPVGEIHNTVRFRHLQARCLELIMCAARHLNGV